MLHGENTKRENTNKHDLCSSTSYLMSFQLIVIIMGEGGDSFTACLSRPLQFRCKLIVTES